MLRTAQCTPSTGMHDTVWRTWSPHHIRLCFVSLVALSPAPSEVVRRMGCSSVARTTHCTFRAEFVLLFMSSCTEDSAQLLSDRWQFVLSLTAMELDLNMSDIENLHGHIKSNSPSGSHWAKPCVGNWFRTWGVSRPTDQALFACVCHVLYVNKCKRLL